MDRFELLFKLLCEIINDQIKKYTALQKNGVGPDAGISISTITAQVDELLKLANALLEDKKASHESKSHNDVFETTLKQTLFYIQQEYIRGKAGWLIDSNNIHSPALTRITYQRNQLMDLAEQTHISTDFLSAESEAQKQCRHDSYAIAKRILDLAIQLKEDPKKEFKEEIPEHAQAILRRHAQQGGRYHDKKTWEAIQELHKEAENFLDNSPLTKSTQTLSNDAVNNLVTSHKDSLAKLHAKFKGIEPNLSIFSTENDAQLKKNTSLSNSSFFMGATAAAGIAVCALIAYLARNEYSTFLPGYRFLP